MNDEYFLTALSGIPFRSLFDNLGYREIVFEEFKKVKESDLILSANKYIKTEHPDKWQAYQNRERIPMSTSTAANSLVSSTKEEDEIRDLILKFNEIYAPPVIIPVEWFVPDIKETPLYKTLSAVGKSIEGYKELVKKEVDESKNADEYFTNIIDLVEAVDNKSLRLDILESIKNDDSNFHVDFLNVIQKFDEAKIQGGRWGNLRIKLNSLIIKYINNLKGAPSLKYNGIADKLSIYIGGATDYILESIIDKQKLPDGISKLRWIGRRADAFRFRKWCNMTCAPFDKCFDFPDNKKSRDSDGSNIYIELSGSIWSKLEEFKR